MPAVARNAAFARRGVDASTAERVRPDRVLRAVARRSGWPVVAH
jgi:hypothetical protein